MAGNGDTMKRLEWTEWQDSHILVNTDTSRNEAWVQHYPDLGWRVEIWRMYNGKPDWVRITYVPELDAAKLIAKLNLGN
jgi:hypothetical protein